MTMKRLRELVLRWTHRGHTVDTPGFRFSSRGYGLAEQQGDVREEAPAQARVGDVLTAYYFSAEAVESRRQAAEWAAAADWGSCQCLRLDWIAH